MSMVNIVGLAWWVVACFFGVLYQWEGKDAMSRKGIILKGIAAFCVVGYAITLIAMFGNPSDASIDFVIGLVLVSLGDILVAYLEHVGDGTSKSLLDAIAGQSFVKKIIISITGVLFIVSYFMQMVAFIKGISQYANATDFVVPFLICLVLPPVITVFGGILAKYRIPDTDLSVFIIGAFYILLASAHFAAATVFAISLSRTDALHSVWIIFGSFLFFLSLLTVELRIAKPAMHDTRIMRMTSRLLTFLGRMILAGCAFLL